MKYGYPYLSIDHLKMGLIRCGYTELTPVSGDKELTEYLWPVVREMIRTAIENGQNLIVEGCYIPFDWAESFEDEYRKHIRYRCLIMSERYIREHFDDIRKYAGTIEQRLDDAGLSSEELVRDNAAALAQCQRCRADYVLIDEAYCVDADF